MGQKFAGQVVWIVGASSGIGRALALQFAAQGADLALSGRRQERLQQVVTEVEALGQKALAVVCDVQEESSVADAADRVAAHFGKIDVAVANAGFAVGGPIEALSAADWRRQLDVNVVGLAMTARYALGHLRKSRGRLVLVGSVTSMIATARNGAYTASKYAVRAIGQTLSLELHGSGVTCTTIHPGFVESEIGQVDNGGVFDGSRKDGRPKRLMWSAEAAAKNMIGAIYRRKREHVFTGHGIVGAFVGQHLPSLSYFAQRRSVGRSRSRKKLRS